MSNKHAMIFIYLLLINFSLSDKSHSQNISSKCDHNYFDYKHSLYTDSFNANSSIL